MNTVRQATYILKQAKVSDKARKDLEDAALEWQAYKNSIGCANGEPYGHRQIEEHLSKARPAVIRMLKERYGGDLSKDTAAKAERISASLHTWLPMLMGTAAGAAIGLGSKSSNPGHVIDSVTRGLTGGLAAGVIPTMVGGLLAQKRNRTLKEQAELDEKPVSWKNYVIPGYAAYNATMRDKLYRAMLRSQNPESLLND